MERVISCRDISRVFDRTIALDGVSIEFESNKIYGLLGRNGAGKTTLLKIISNQLFPTTGFVKIEGQSPYENEEVLNKICYVSENTFYPKEFKVSDIISTAAEFYPYWDKDLASRLIMGFGLDMKKRFKMLSKGMQSSLAIVIGICSRAPITIFDEAYLGLDASMRQLFYDTLLEDYGNSPRTVIFSSHLIDECSNLFEEVIILDKGKILLHENAESLRERSFLVGGNKERVESWIKGRNIIHMEQMGRLVSSAVFSRITEAEQKAMAGEGIEVLPMSLQKLFIYLTLSDGGEMYEKNGNAV